MAYVIADNIVSPLGKTTEENLQAVLAGKSALRAFHDPRGLLEPYTASLFETKDGRLTFDGMLLQSVRQAITTVNIDLTHTMLIVSTTKGELFTPLSETAQHVADEVGIKTKPIVVCNACISGLAAVILAQRLLEAGACRYAVVCGADRQTDFIISGFQSLKALSPTPCRPFDMERTGLNLGEAAATMILSNNPTTADCWHIERGSIHNDAYHVTTPARQADGLYACLQEVLEGIDKESLAVVNAHGTATLFNDQMEGIAIKRAGLTATPVNALKGYFGHTMGAAGILETILTMHALDEQYIIGTRGLKELGVSASLKMSEEHDKTDKSRFVKMLSGFGGCNAAIVASKEQEEASSGEDTTKQTLHALHHVLITPSGVTLDGQTLHTEGKGTDMLTSLYKQTVGDYPKYYKMDPLSRLGFLASELLLNAEGEERFAPCQDRAVIFFNHSSSIVSDKKYQTSISPDNYFPSPSVFIYTLPNIVTGEIAIRNHYQGETSFYILPERDTSLQTTIVQASLKAQGASSAITGWIDCEDEAHFTADISLVTVHE